MLVEMNISVWTAAITDRNATTKVTDDANATADAGKFKKNLMAGTSVRKDIADYAALCRTWHNGRTLPWSDKGVRLLPTSMFFDYKTEVNARRDYFNAKLAKFLTEYPTLVTIAQRNLGGLSNAADYPSVDEIASKFAFKLVFSPVPEAGDFRLTAGSVDMAELKAQYESAYEDRIGEAMKTSWNKLHNTLLGMSEKLAEPEGEASKQFRTTFVTNVKDMCALLTHLNITKDPELELARRDLERAISSVDIEDIRSDVGARTDLKAQVDAVLGRYDW
jgi:hypothetical protein